MLHRASGYCCARVVRLVGSLGRLVLTVATSLKSSRDPGSNTVTNGVRIVVRPFYIAEQSQPEHSKFAWGYRIRMTNEGDRRCRLLRRHWLIVDGEGVVGHFPDLSPGEFFEYTSFCPLEYPWGTMEGSYEFIDEDGKHFETVIGRFFLVSPHV
jgi:ApaG protein